MYTLLDRTTLDLLGGTAPSFGLGALRDLTECVAVLGTTGHVTQFSKGSLTAFDIAQDARLSPKVFWWDIWPEDTRAPVREAVMRGLNGHITQYWSPFVHADGSISQWNMRLSPLQDSASQVASVIVVSQRLTTH